MVPRRQSLAEITIKDRSIREKAIAMIESVVGHCSTFGILDRERAIAQASFNLSCGKSMQERIRVRTELAGPAVARPALQDVLKQEAISACATHRGDVSCSECSNDG